jgi:glycosyltransferase involved in cell wall biosynthesis
VSATVIIPTTNRSTLDDCVSSVLAQVPHADLQVVVVDDGPTPTVDPAKFGSGVEVVRSGGRGPAAARNVGLANATGAVVFFTDDDVVVDRGWVAAGCAYLEQHRQAGGVEGVVRTRPYDYLFEQSMQNDRPGAYWTCNIAYRKHVLAEVGGFSSDFPWPHGEDLDLAFRVLERAPIGFSPEMVVTHVPRAVSIWDVIRQGRWIVSSITLMQRHPQHYPKGGLLAQSVWQLSGGLRHWARRARDDRRRLLSSPCLLGRIILIAGGHAVVSTAAIIRWQFETRAPR